MPAAYQPILVLFVDGVGLAPASIENPFSTVETPAIESLLGGPLTSETVQVGERRVLIGLDATLGVPGLPQSATGQASLFTGVNGAEMVGSHQTGFPGPSLRALVAQQGLLARARRVGCAVTFANGYSQGYLEQLEKGRGRFSVTTCAALAAGLELRDLEDLARGRAVSWDFCRDHFAARSGEAVPAISARQAGRDLVGIAVGHHLTLFETFLTDLAGHLKRGISPAEAITRLDDLIAGLEEARPEDLTWILTSDHGNLEDVGTGSHTLNPVPLMAVGPAAGKLADLDSILGVTAAILRLLRPSDRPGQAAS